MFICLCHGITDKVIKKLKQEGLCSSVREVQKNCRAGANCGACIMQIKELLDEEGSGTDDHNKSA